MPYVIEEKEFSGPGNTPGNGTFPHARHIAYGKPRQIEQNVSPLVA
jgi:hypothetical protein